MSDEKTKPEQKKLKPCCACPETKKPRDEWYATAGEYIFTFPPPDFER